MSTSTRSHAGRCCPGPHEMEMVNMSPAAADQAVRHEHFTSNAEGARERERERESCLSQAGVETNMEADTSIMYIRRMRPCKR